ncbi:MAG: hypothetical protein ABEJ65_07435, partial [bacterium]
MEWLLDYSLEGWVNLLSQGGLIIGFLLLISLIGLAIVIQKFMRLRRKQVFDEGSAVNLLLAIKKGDS